MNVGINMANNSEMSIDDCKNMITRVAIQHKCSAKLIATRLLGKEDKQDMLDGNLGEETLMVATGCWLSSGMPDYSNGDTAFWRRFYE